MRRGTQAVVVVSCLFALCGYHRIVLSLATSPERLVARAYNSGFEYAHDTYNGMGVGSDGKIYYVLCSEGYDVGGKLYSYDPIRDQIRYGGDLTEAAGEKDLKAIPQGKSHSQLIESNGKLYFSTHIGYYVLVNGISYPGTAPGYKPYPGGHFLSYDIASGTFENLAVTPTHEGIQASTMDVQRQRLYALTWPTSHFLRYDLPTKSMKDLGPVSLGGEAMRGPRYRVICRSPQVDPTDGSVYFTRSDGLILRYRYDRDAIESVAGEDMRKDYFGVYDPSSPGSMAYNWRQTVWCARDRMIYGVHGNSGYLFRFDPRQPRIEVLERLTSEPSKRSGMYDQFTYGYLGFTLGPDGHTLYYLTGGPISNKAERTTAEKTSTTGGVGGGEFRKQEDLHLVTYDLATSTYRDHGAIFFPNGQRPTWVNSIAVGKDGTVYTLGRITENGRTRADLIRIPVPN